MKGLRFQTKLFLLYSFIITVIIFISFTAFYIYITKTTEDRAVDNLQQLIIKTSSQTDTIIENMDNVALSVTSNPRVQEILKHAQSNSLPTNYFESNLDAYTEMTKELLYIIGPKMSIPRISIFTLFGDYSSMGEYYESTDAIQNRLHTSDINIIFSDLIKLKGRKLLSSYHKDYWSNNKDLKLISLFRPIKYFSTDSEDLYGVVEVQQNYNKISNLLDFGKDSGIKAYLFSDKGQLIYPEATSPDSTEDFTRKYWDELNAKNTNDSQKIHIANSDYLFFSKKSSLSGWTLVLSQPMNILLHPITIIGEVVLFVGLGLIILTLLTIFIISNIVTKPLRQLKHLVGEVTINNLSVEIDQSTNNDEIIQLNSSFNDMFLRLKKSITQESKAHLLALQSQMDPHFLYNMLAVISATGQDIGSMKIMNMCGKLSEMLRYVSNFSENYSTLGSELDHTQNYLNLMKDRYEDFFKYEVSTISKQILETKVPKHLIQPLTENCFQHGFKNLAPPWQIKVSIYNDDDYWFVEVLDNGTGFDDITLQNIIKTADEFLKNPEIGLQTFSLGGLGLMNTYSRLRLIYGDYMVFKVENVLNYGSKITVGGKLK